MDLYFTNHSFKTSVGMTRMFSPHRAITVPQLRSVLKSLGCDTMLFCLETTEQATFLLDLLDFKEQHWANLESCEI